MTVLVVIALPWNGTKWDNRPMHNLAWKVLERKHLWAHWKTCLTGLSWRLSKCTQSFFYPLIWVLSFQYTYHSTTYLEHRGRLHEISMIGVWINHCHLCFFGNRDIRFNSQIRPQLWANACIMGQSSDKFTLLKMILQYVVNWWCALLRFFKYKFVLTTRV